MKLILAGVVALSGVARAETSKFFNVEVPDYAAGYRNQAAGFSDRVLVRELNAPSYAWLWIKPRHVLAELKARGAQSPAAAQRLLTSLINALAGQEPAADYVTEALIKLLGQAQAQGMMGDEALRAVLTGVGADGPRGEPGGVLRAFVKDQMILEPRAVSREVAVMAITHLAGLPHASGRVQTLGKELALSLAGDGVRAVKVAEILRDARRDDWRRDLLLAAVLVNRAPVVAYTAKVIEAARVTSEGDYERLAADIEVVTKHGDKDAVAKIEGKLKSILAELQRQRVARVSGGSAGGGGGGGGGSGGNASGDRVASFSGEYVAGRLDGHSYTQIISAFLGRPDLARVLYHVADALVDSCDRAAQTKDAEVSAYCINVLVPAVLRLGTSHERFDIMVKQIILATGTSHDGTSFRLACHAFDVESEIQAELKTLDQLMDLKLTLVAGRGAIRLPVRAEPCADGQAGAEREDVFSFVFLRSLALRPHASGEWVSLCTNRLRGHADPHSTYRALRRLNDRLVHENGKAIPSKLLWAILKHRTETPLPSSEAYRGYDAFARGRHILRDERPREFDEVCAHVSRGAAPRAGGTSLLYFGLKTHRRPIAPVHLDNAVMMTTKATRASTTP